MKLIISEKANAAQRIAEILSDGQPAVRQVGAVDVHTWNNTQCIGLSGHVVGVDFPDEYSDWTDVDPEELIDAEIVKTPTREDIVASLKELATTADRVIIATDYDREGELIGKEAYELVRDVNPTVPVERVRFSSITEQEVTRAFENPDEIDFDLAAAGEARQIIDLIWGAALTRFLSLAAKQYGDDFISVGRVQSPTLKLIVDREREIEAFDPEDYWELFADLIQDNDDTTFEAQYYYLDADDNEAERIWDQAEAEAVYSALEEADVATVTDVNRRTRTDRPPAPFNTTQFIRAAGAIGFSAKRAMSIAEDLYTAGHITYPRTDNTVYPDELNPVDLLSTFASAGTFDDDARSLLDQDTISPTRGDSATTDHPPIHPTVDIPDKRDLSQAEWRIYELVVRRFFATVAESAIWEHLRVVVDANGLAMKANGKRLVEPGYHDVYPYFDTEENYVPAVTVDEEVAITETDLVQKQTQPPRRYGQSRLIETMEDLGIGTKCLTADTAVLVRSESGGVHQRSLEELFGAGQPVLADGDTDIATTDSPVTTLSFSETTLTLSDRSQTLISRRPLEDDEQVYRITTNAGSFSATGDHPVYVNDDQVKIKPVSALVPGDDLLTARRLPSVSMDSGDVLLDKAECLKAVDPSADDVEWPHLERVLSDLGTERHSSDSRYPQASKELRHRITFRHDAETGYSENHDRPLAADSTHLREEIATDCCPIRWTTDLARIIATVLGSESVISRDPPELLLEFESITQRRLNRLRSAFETVVGDISISRDHNASDLDSTQEVRLEFSPKLSKLILTVLDSVLTGDSVRIPSDFRPAFIGAMFDQAGRVTSDGAICVSVTNPSLRTTLSEYLSEQAIHATSDPQTNELRIDDRRSRERFFDTVPVISETAFYHGVSGLQSSTRSQLKAAIFQAVSTGVQSVDDLIEHLDSSAELVRDLIGELAEDGYIDTVIDGDQSRIEPDSEFSESIYATLRERPSSLTVQEISTRNYDGPVYDLTIDEDAPNFAVTGGVIVHNSTRHNTIDKLYDRGYIEENPPRPTQLARGVVDAAEDYADLVVSESMTAQLEEDMTAIADGEVTLDEVTDESREMLQRVFDELKPSEEEIGERIQEALKADKTLGPCPECESELLVRSSRYGSHFVGCDGYPDCEYTLPLPNKGEPLVLSEHCEEHGLNHVKMLAGRGTFVHGCPQCKADEADAEEDRVIGDCPDCGDTHGGELAIKTLRSGSRLVGCTRYPDCDYSLPLPRRGNIEITEETCDDHGLPELEVHSGDDPWELGCPICNYQEYQAQQASGEEANGGLNGITGIGTKTVEKLESAGIETLDDLTGADPDDLAGTIQGVSAQQLREWQAQARS